MPEKKETKRLFFGFEVTAPWPEKLPSGRLLDPKCRHLTVAFLGDIPIEPLNTALPSIPLPPFPVGLVGQFDSYHFLPHQRPNVISWGIKWLEDTSSLFDYQKTLSNWALDHNLFQRQPHPGWLPHVTIARKPFRFSEWKKVFSPLPLMITNLHLYESLGQLQYQPYWSSSVLSPFEEIDHTADVAYHVRGKSILQLYQHAFTALCFLCPDCLSYYNPDLSPESLDAIIASLNEVVTHTDVDVGCSLKAVSYHGEIKEREDGLLEWEMIVDV